MNQNNTTENNSSETALCNIDGVSKSLLFKNRKAKCYNCKFSGQAFKVDKLTHYHCEDPKEYTQEKWDNDEFTAWDTLRVFSDSCDNHQFKDS